MSILRTTAKTALSGLLHYSGTYGALAWLGERVGQSGLAVLTYHRVLPPEEAQVEPDPGIVTTTSCFEAQMRYISKHCAALDLQEAVERMQRGHSLPRRACAITFDDGWLDTYTHAYPILRHFGLPATIFVTTQCIGTTRPLWTRLAVDVLGHASKSDLQRVVSRVCTSDGIEALKQTLAGKHGPEGMLSLLKPLPADVREGIVGELEPSVSVQQRSDPWLTWDQLREMSANGIAVGSHTQTHAILPAESAARVREEVVGARDELRRRLGSAPAAFCYPNGEHNTEVAAIVRDAGHELACTTRLGVAKPVTDRYLLPRIDMHENVVAGISGNFSPSLFVRRTQHGIRWRPSARRRTCPQGTSVSTCEASSQTHRIRGLS
ncbi:MAG: polysaccharide deacetylase family protein [Armatimonadetes bacterium]|nr:polysaccharide deacetylase family protein [Armatimonadota bacterium]